MLIYQRVNEPQTLQSSPLLARPEHSFGSLGHVRSLRVGSLIHLIQGAGRHSCPPFGYPSPLRCHPKEPQPPPAKKNVERCGTPGGAWKHCAASFHGGAEKWSTVMVGKIHIYANVYRKNPHLCRVYVGLQGKNPQFLKKYKTKHQPRHHQHCSSIAAQLGSHTRPPRRIQRG